MKVTFTINLREQKGGYYTLRTTREDENFPSFVPGMEVDFPQLSDFLLVEKVVWSETHRVLFVYLKTNMHSDVEKILETLLTNTRNKLGWEVASFAGPRIVTTRS